MSPQAGEGSPRIRSIRSPESVDRSCLHEARFLPTADSWASPRGSLSLWERAMVRVARLPASRRRVRVALASRERLDRPRLSGTADLVTGSARKRCEQRYHLYMTPRLTLRRSKEVFSTR